MADSKIPALDDLLAGTVPDAVIGPGSDPEAVGAVQDLLRGHAATGMPGLSISARGQFGPKTSQAVRLFRRHHGLSDGSVVDQATLRKLIDVLAPLPLATQAYLTLVLDREFTANLKVVSVVTRLIRGGRFADALKNPDQAGLSFGMLPWSQRRGRLHGLIQTFQDAHPDIAAGCFGGDARLTGLLTHTSDANSNGIDSNGNTTDADFNLIGHYWSARFDQAGRTPALQVVQAEHARQFFATTYTNVITAHMPLLTSERGVAFAFEMILQFDGVGARNLYDAAVASGPADEPLLLIRLRDASVAQLLTTDFPDYPQVAQAARDRRNFLISTPLLSNAPFVADGESPPATLPPFSPARAASYFLMPRASQGVRAPVASVDAEHFVMGETALPAMYRVIRDAVTPGDFIYMLNWHFDHKLEVDVGTPAVPLVTTLENILTTAAAAGTQIRSMMWSGPTIQPASPFFLLTAFRLGRPDLLLAELVLDHFIGTFAPQTEINAATAEFLDGLNTGAADVRAILDHQRGLIGTHHQKLLVVRAGGQLVAFVGGIEYNLDRLHGDDASHTGPPTGAPLFDTAVRLEDPGATMALQTFVDRWMAHPDNADKPPDLIGAVPTPPAPGTGTLAVQFTTTYGRGYSPNDGEPVWSASDAITNAILNAQTYFYIEDQYFVGNEKLATAIRQAFARRPGLLGIVVIAAEDCVTDFDLSRFGSTPKFDPPPFNIIGHRRRRFIDPLRQSLSGRLLVFERLGTDSAGLPSSKGATAYVHSKLLFVDDEAALIGSVNASHRSWYHDTEVDATLVDTAGPGGAAAADRGWVRKFRCEVWENHLGQPCHGDLATDLNRWKRVASGQTPTPGSPPPPFVRLYDDPPSGIHPPGSLDDVLWRLIYDPV